MSGWDMTAKMLADTRELVTAAGEAGLVVTMMSPTQCHRSTCWTVALWTPSGGLWMEASHESKRSIMDAVTMYARREAPPGAPS